MMPARNTPRKAASGTQRFVLENATFRVFRTHRFVFECAVPVRRTASSIPVQIKIDL